MIVEDTTLDKLYSKKIGFVRYQWSEEHHRTVKGIGLITLIWTDGEKILPVYFRIYDIDEDEKSKNDHFLNMLEKVKEHGLKPKFVMFDTWYASVKNLKDIRKNNDIFSNKIEIKSFGES